MLAKSNNKMRLILPNTKIDTIGRPKWYQTRYQNSGKDQKPKNNFICVYAYVEIVISITSIFTYVQEHESIHAGNCSPGQ